jgi:hypothetical protein
VNADRPERPPQTFECKTAGCGLTVQYRRRHVPVLGHRRKGVRVARTVYLTCGNQHTHHYALEGPQ